MCNLVHNGVQRSGDARGDYLIGCPLPNSSIEQWRIVVMVIVIGQARNQGRAFAPPKFSKHCIAILAFAETFQ